jgi:hypothetical protein
MVVAMLETRLVWMPEDIKGFWDEILKEMPDLTIKDAPSRWCVALKDATYPTPVVLVLDGKLVGVTGWRRVGDTLNALILLRGMRNCITVPTLLLPAKRLEVLRHLAAIRLALRIEAKYGIPFIETIKVVPYRARGFDAEVRQHRLSFKDTHPFTTLTASPTLVFVELFCWTPNGFISTCCLPPNIAPDTLEKAVAEATLDAYLHSPNIKGV